MEHGLAELVACLQLASELFATVFDEALTETVAWTRVLDADQCTWVRWCAGSLIGTTTRTCTVLIQFITPVLLLAQRHAGRDADILAARREQVYRDAKARHPQRWSGNIGNDRPVGDVHFNPQKDSTEIKTNRAA